MPPDLGPIPLDDDALTAIEHALNAVYTLNDEGQPQTTDADYNLPQLLDFWSGHDRVDDVLVDEWAGTKVYERAKPSYSEQDLLRALVGEVRRLRPKPTDKKLDCGVCTRDDSNEERIVVTYLAECGNHGMY